MTTESEEKMDITAVEERLKSILKYVNDCIYRVSKGEIMDLQGLDNNVIEICNAVIALPREEAEGVEDQMATLIEKLELLANEMRDQQDKIEAEEQQATKGSK